MIHVSMLLAEQTSLAFAYDCYRRLLQMLAMSFMVSHKENFNRLLIEAEKEKQSNGY